MNIMKSENDSQDNPKQVGVPESPKNWNEIQKKLQKQNHISVKFYTLKELAEIYKVCIPTFKRMIAPYEEIIGKHKGRYYTITQVKLIFQYVDLPSTYTMKELAHVYNVSIPTFKSWLDNFHDELGEKPGHFYSFRQLYIIITKLDIPSIEGREHDYFVAFLQFCNNNINLIWLYCYFIFSFAQCSNGLDIL
jgi:hypothetical protein